MDLKKPLSFQQQVDRLVEHGMYLDSKSDAVTFLSNVNYYRFTGYALQFRAKNGQDYIEGTSFEQVKEIYLFDEALRGILRDGLECVETMLRARIANGFAMAKCMEPPYAGHYDPANFSGRNCISSSWIHCKKKKKDIRTVLSSSIIKINMTIRCRSG